MDVQKKVNGHPAVETSGQMSHADCLTIGGHSTAKKWRQVAKSRKVLKEWQATHGWLLDLNIPNMPPRDLCAFPPPTSSTSGRSVTELLLLLFRAIWEHYQIKSNKMNMKNKNSFLCVGVVAVLWRCRRRRLCGACNGGGGGVSNLPTHECSPPPTQFVHPVAP
jgi:hypothetical protein